MKIIKRIIFLGCTILISCSCASIAPTVLLQVDRSTDSIPLKRGPNLNKFSHGFLYVGFITGEDKPGARINYGNSVDFGLGARKKYKLSPLYSLGWEVGADGKMFKLKQEKEKVLPDTVLNSAEWMDFSSLYVSFFNRFNFDTHRGNYMGTFLDIGISGEWDFTIAHTIKNSLPDGSKIEAKITGLPYVNNFNYNLFARFGISHVSLFALYRMTNSFKSTFNYPELPRLTAGLELAIFRQ